MVVVVVKMVVVRDYGCDDSNGGGGVDVWASGFGDGGSVESGRDDGGSGGGGCSRDDSGLGLRF